MSLPPLPPGFTLDQQGPPQVAAGGMPPLPPGFTLDGQAPAERSMGDRVRQKLAEQSIRQGGASQQHLTPEWQNKALQGGREVAREVGRYGQMAAQGGSALITLPYDAMTGFLNLALEKAGVNYRLPSASGAMRDLVDHPELRDRDSVESLQRTIGETGFGALTGIGTGRALAAGYSGTAGAVGSVMAANPGTQLVSAGTGGAAAGVTREMGGGPVAQTVAGIAGSLVPSVPAMAREGARAIARGGATQQQIRDNIDTFQATGAQPTVGQATEGRFNRGVEALMAKTPGGAGPMAGAASRQADDIAAGVEAQAAKLGPSKSPAQIGMKVDDGVGDFVARFKSRASGLYGKVDAYIPPQTDVAVTNTQRALTRLTAPIKGAEELSKILSNAKVVQIDDALAADLAGKPPTRTITILGADGQPLSTVAIGGAPAKTALPYEALKQIRSKVGDLLSGSDLVADVPRAQLKQLYAAITSDMESAATAAGPQATQALKRATSHYNAGMTRIDFLQRVVTKNGGPEAIYRAATSGTREGATTLRTVMQSLPKGEQRMLAASVVRRLGIAKPGVQNELGDQFSTETFLTNWNTLSADAKRTLFSRFGPTYRADMDKFAAVAANIRAGSKVFQNPSGTGQATAQTAAAGTFLYTVVTGDFGGAALIAGGVGGAYGTARLMTSPTVVKFLASNARKPLAALPAALNELQLEARRTDDPAAQEAAELFSEALSQQTTESAGPATP